MNRNNQRFINKCPASGGLFLAAAATLLFAAANVPGIDEFNLDRLFGLPAQPETDRLISGFDTLKPSLAFDERGVKKYSINIEGWGIYARKYGLVRREVALSDMFYLEPGTPDQVFVVHDIISPEYGAVGALRFEVKFPKGHVLIFDGFATSFQEYHQETQNVLEARNLSVRYDWRAVEDSWGFFDLEVGYDHFDSRAEFVNWFEPSYEPTVSKQTVPNPVIGFHARLSTGATSAVEFGLRMNPCPLDWLDSNLVRADAKWEYVFSRLTAVSVGYDLFDIRFQDTGDGEFADLTMHGPYAALGIFF